MLKNLLIAFTSGAYNPSGELHGWASNLYNMYCKLAQRSSHVVITDCPSVADYILFVDAHFVRNESYSRLVRDSVYFRDFPEKVFVYNQSDNPRLGLPGLYVSMPKQLYSREYMRSVPYMHYELDRFDLGEFRSCTKVLNSSFIGDRNTSSVRQRMFESKLEYVSMTDTHHFGFHDYSSKRKSEDELLLHTRNYCANVAKSIFSICPRGYGTSSFRLFESLMLGTIPIVLSDDFVPPDYLGQSNYFFQLAEKRVSHLDKFVLQCNVSRSSMKESCQSIVENVLDLSVRLDYMVSKLDEIKDNSCNYHESISDLISHKIYWRLRTLRKF